MGISYKSGFGRPSLHNFNEFMDLKKKLCTKKNIEYNYRTVKEEFQNLNKFQCLSEIKRLRKELENE